jgi:hypothetical protein
VPDAVLINYIGPQQIRASAVEAVLKRTLPEAMSSVCTLIPELLRNLCFCFSHYQFHT